MFKVSERSNCEQIVEEILRQLGQGTTGQVFERVKAIDQTASRYRVGKILKEGGFAEPGVAEITINRKGAPYKKSTPVWIYKPQIREEVMKAPTESGPIVEAIILPRQPATPYHAIRKVEKKKPEIVEAQFLQITVRNLAVNRLHVKVLFDDGGKWFDGKIASYLDWGTRKWFDFLANQTERIDFWMAYKVGGVEKILLNLWSGRPTILPLKEIYQRTNPYIDVNLQFIGEGLNDQKPRNYRLNAQSWEKINLTDRP